MRARPATIFADSMRQTASIVAFATWVAEAAKLALLGLLLELRAQGGFAARGFLHVCGEVLELLHLPDSTISPSASGSARPTTASLGLQPGSSRNRDHSFASAKGPS